MSRRLFDITKEAKAIVGKMKHGLSYSLGPEKDAISILVEFARKVQFAENEACRLTAKKYEPSIYEDREDIPGRVSEEIKKRVEPFKPVGRPK